MYDCNNEQDVEKTSTYSCSHQETAAEYIGPAMCFLGTVIAAVGCVSCCRHSGAKWKLLTVSLADTFTQHDLFETKNSAQGRWGDPETNWQVETSKTKYNTIVMHWVDACESLQVLSF